MQLLNELNYIKLSQTWRCSLVRDVQLNSGDHGGDAQHLLHYVADLLLERHWQVLNLVSTDKSQTTAPSRREAPGGEHIRYQSSM